MAYSPYTRLPPDGIEPPFLPIEKMDERHHGLAPDVAAYLLAAARVCLDRREGVSPRHFTFLSNQTAPVQVQIAWSPADDRLRDSFANHYECTEQGACACALAAAELFFGWVAKRRAENHSGADYYVGPGHHPMKDFDDPECYKLEISGCDECEGPSLRARLRRKVEQVRRGKPIRPGHRHPALAIVVGFRAAIIISHHL